MNIRFLRLWRSAAGGPGRDLIVALALKGLLLLVLYLVFFSPSHRPAADAGATARALLGTNDSKDVR